MATRVMMRRWREWLAEGGGAWKEGNGWEECHTSNSFIMNLRNACKFMPRPSSVPVSSEYAPHTFFSWFKPNLVLAPSLSCVPAAPAICRREHVCFQRQRW